MDNALYNLIGSIPIAIVLIVKEFLQFMQKKDTIDAIHELTVEVKTLCITYNERSKNIK